MHTPRGGGHVYVDALLKTTTNVFDRCRCDRDHDGNLDVRGKASYAVFAGRNYSRPHWPPGVYGVEDLPPWIRQVLQFPNGEPVDTDETVVGCEDLLERALGESVPGNRNGRGLWLACQLRDNGIGESEAEEVVENFARRVPAGDHPYSENEALATLRSVYKTAPRDPWGTGDRNNGEPLDLRPNLWSLGAFLARPRSRMIVEDMLSEGALGVLYGPPGAGKTGSSSRSVERALMVGPVKGPS